MSREWISADEWRTIVANVPIVSVDLLVRHDGGLLFGKRSNQPAQGYWFPPGGRVWKGETRQEAVHRIAMEELGLDVKIVESLGAFEHIYDAADVQDVGGKHYLANGYIVDVLGGELSLDDQHDAIRVFETTPDPLHDYLEAYLRATNLLSGWI